MKTEEIIEVLERFGQFIRQSEYFESEDYKEYADEIMTITEPSHQDYRDLIDIVWNYVYEDTSVPSTSTADKLIEQWLSSKNEVNVKDIIAVNKMKTYNITTNHKSFEVETNSMLSAMFAVYRKIGKVENIIAVIREDYDGEIKENSMHDKFCEATDKVLNSLYGDESEPQPRIIVTLKEANEIIKREHGDVPYTKSEPEVSEYNDLISQISHKHPNESRHETAKRYIMEAESAYNKTGSFEDDGT